MTATSIISNWEKKEFKPLYWLEGDEDYFIDQVIDFAESGILPETEASFNLTILALYAGLQEYRASSQF